ncbi:hypothetical protein [Photorhabdus khanii]|uniref:Uncharacterized protein n=1 Tax=Photorhabdus khanii subsp. guanajuatensis TaxID=2100166 RepID=A0A4R4IQM3_9GAMM|nr:hypothetical protein [Photorhabdus khanii]TDB42671.1 hypothetical protein C5467_23650 [Photorhabdus khanii subsp. guanajuatensis]
MDKKIVLNILNSTLDALEKEKELYDKHDLMNIINKYKSVIEKISNDIIEYNAIHNSVRAYLEIYNDYDNPLLYKMSDAEEAVSEYLSNI